MILLPQVRGVMARREVLSTLVRRDLTVRYAGSPIGYLWTIIDPLAMAFIYFAVFGLIFQGRSVGYQPYVLFILIGVLVWQWFLQCVTETSRSLQAEARLVRSNNLPRELWVVRVVIAKGIEFVLSLPVLGAFALYFIIRGEAHLNWRLLLVPLAIGVQSMLMVGLGLMLAPVTVLFNDTSRVVRIALRVGFYATPILYGSHALPAAVRDLLMFNPMSGILEMYRSGFFPAEFNWQAMVISMVISVLMLVVGTRVFQKLEPAVLKEI